MLGTHAATGPRLMVRPASGATKSAGEALAAGGRILVQPQLGLVLRGMPPLRAPRGDSGLRGRRGYLHRTGPAVPFPQNYWATKTYEDPRHALASRQAQASEKRNASRPSKTHYDRMLTGSDLTDETVWDSFILILTSTPAGRKWDALIWTQRILLDDLASAWPRDVLLVMARREGKVHRRRGSTLSVAIAFTDGTGAASKDIHSCISRFAIIRPIDFAIAKRAAPVSSRRASGTSCARLSAGNEPISAHTIGPSRPSRAVSDYLERNRRDVRAYRSGLLS